jgi:uncharacterized protein related to proFAR isomerase
MYLALNMLSENDDDNNVINEFKILTQLFAHNGWKNNINNRSLEHIMYTKIGNETEFFEIKLDNNNIYVSVPLKNSEFQYKVKFNNYLSAIKYTEDKFNYFNDTDIVNYNNVNNY